MASRPRSSPAPARTLLGVLLGALLLAAAVAVPLLLRPTPGDGRGTSEDEGWQAGRSMSQRRSYIAAAEVEGRLYVAGGMVGETGRRLRLLQRYDPATDAWTGLASLPVPTRAAAAAADDGQV